MKIDWKICQRVGISMFLLFLAIHYWEAFVMLLKVLIVAATPLTMGFIIAYIINIPMQFYEKHYFIKSKSRIVQKSRRPVCMILAFLSVFVLILLVFRIVTPELGNCINLLLTTVPTALNRVTDRLARSDFLSETITSTLSEINWKDILSKTLNSVVNGVGNAASIAVNMLSSFISLAVNLLIAFIFSIYLLSGKERLFGQIDRTCHRYLKKEWIDKVRYVLGIVNDCFHRYIVGQCTEAVILGVLCSLGMIIFQFPYAAVVGATVAFTALIPVAGAYIGGAVGFLLILTVSPMKALLFVVYLVILQQLEGNIIYPKVVGKSMGLPGVWVLGAVTIGGGIAGIMGMLLSVPLVASLYQLIRNDVKKAETATSKVST